MKTVFIYALCEPGTRKIRYIGKSWSPKQRLNSHCKESCKQRNRLGNWIVKLGKLRQSPLLIVLKEVLELEWPEWERRYIRCARALGFDLVNGTDGGESPPSCLGKPCSAATRAKIGFANSGVRSSRFGKPGVNLGKRVSIAVREKMRQAKLGSTHSLWARKRIGLGNSNPYDETRLKMRLSKLGENNPSYGKSPSVETRLRTKITRTFSTLFKQLEPII